MSLPLSILDQSPIVADASPGDAIAATIALARRAEQLGYRRYWLAEHHAMRGLADASPELLLARLTAETSQLRLGTGGIMLPHYSALKVAESFRMLEALAPGRIDLGVGRAPGGSGLVSAALQSRDVADFPQQIIDVIDYLNATTPARSPFATLTAMPSGRSSPDVWLLGSSDYGALLAAELGLPYTFAHFIAGDGGAVTRTYRERFKPSAQCAAPRVMLALGAIVAPTDAEAEALTWPVALWRMRLFRGRATTVPSLAETERYPWTPRERDEVETTRRVVFGSPSTVRAKIEALVAAHAADEAMIVTIAPDYASRLRSYELLAQAFAVRERAA
ncbi:MAG: LLM class flavin-dependent oxidoreductase [Candidatus Velthaea sp.]